MGTASNDSRWSSSSLTSTVLIAGGVGAVTFYLTKRHFETKIIQFRKEKYERDQKGRSAENARRQDSGLPNGIKLEGIQSDSVYLQDLEHLGKYFASEGESLVNVMADERLQHRGANYNKYIGPDECILANIRRGPQKSTVTRAFLRAGPRRELHFNPKTVNACIVTCGGLCPGLNNVIREITRSLFYLYGIQGKCYGIVGGYAGFYDPNKPPVELTPETVRHIHHQGGTVLGSSRGGFDINKIIDFIKKKNIRQLYVIGGDGTHRGCYKIHEKCMELGLNVAIAGIPKTIDNDVDYIDRSFGFITSVEVAQAAIEAARTEAMCNLPNGIGIVKLMGRSSGYIAAHATLGSGDVDLCLVPEVPIVLDGETGCLPHLFRRVKNKGYAVVVVAEGAGEELLGASIEKDASGNKKLPMIGEFLKEKISDYFKIKGAEATVKYIDPSYMIRSVPANATDALYCLQLGQNAVHGTMAGYTGFSVGLCNNKMCFLPIPELVATSPRQMNPRGRTWERILAVTRQPNTVPRRKGSIVRVESSV